MSLSSDIAIFWEESGGHVGIYAAYAAVVCGLFGVVQLLSQQTSGALPSVALGSGGLWGLAVGATTLGYFVVGWRPEWLCGELLAIGITTLALPVAFAAACMALPSALGLRLAYPQLVSIVTGLALAAPTAAFWVYVLALGSADWRH